MMLHGRMEDEEERERERAKVVYDVRCVIGSTSSLSLVNLPPKDAPDAFLL